MDANEFDLKVPDVSKPLVKRDNYLKLSETEPTLVTVDNVEAVNLSTDRGIKEAVRVSCRLVIIKNDGTQDKPLTYPTEETMIKESYSTSTFYLLKDFVRTSKWPKEGIFYWAWKAEDGLRWERA
jgi:hypothetical protein